MGERGEGVLHRKQRGRERETKRERDRERKRETYLHRQQKFDNKEFVFILCAEDRTQTMVVVVTMVV